MVLHTHTQVNRRETCTHKELGPDRLCFSANGGIFFIVTATGNRDTQEKKEGKEKEEKKIQRGSATGRIRHRKKFFFLKLAEQKKKYL